LGRFRVCKKGGIYLWGRRFAWVQYRVIYGRGSFSVLPRCLIASPSQIDWCGVRGIPGVAKWRERARYGLKWGRQIGLGVWQGSGGAGAGRQVVGQQGAGLQALLPLIRPGVFLGPTPSQPGRKAPPPPGGGGSARPIKVFLDNPPPRWGESAASGGQKESVISLRRTGRASKVKCRSTCDDCSPRPNPTVRSPRSTPYHTIPYLTDPMLQLDPHAPSVWSEAKVIPGRGPIPPPLARERSLA